ncbi:MAG TPA: TIR domain-containing protein, partial [Thermoanaerobaculia bacterium]|nr:TIR domain-containing protein [Thermoanaerobaculia bacterium]
MRDLLMRRLFGRDLFISYSRPDASEYVRVLAMKVRETRPELSICIDQWAAAPHDTTHPNLLREARRSSLFVLVASENAVKSTNVGAELDEYLKTGRYLLAIDVDGNLAKPSVWSEAARRAIATTSPVTEARERLDPEHPDPSPRVVTRILGAVTFETQTQRIRHFAVRTVAAVAAIVAGAAIFSWFLVKSANEDRALADTKQKFAEQRAIRANKTADLANAETAIASCRANLANAAALVAEGRATDANLRADTAEQRATLAGTEAKHQQDVALALRLANESATILRQQPQHVDRAVRLAADAMTRLHGRGIRTLAADLALRESLALLPAFEPPVTLPGTGDPVASGNGRYIASSDPRRVHLCDTVSRECKTVGEGTGPWSAVAFSRDSGVLAAASGESVSLWSTATRQPLRDPIPFGGAIERIVVGNGGTFVAAAVGERFSVWDEARGMIVPGRQDGDDPIRWMDLSSDEQLLLTVDPARVRIWKWRTEEPPVDLQMKKPVLAAMFSPDGKHVAAIDNVQGLVMWNLDGPARMWSGDIRPPLHFARFSDDGKQIAASRFRGSGVRVYDVESGQGTSIETAGRWLAFSRDGTRLATGAKDFASLWRLSDGRELGRAPHSGIAYVTFRDDGSIVSFARGEELRAWRPNAAFPSDVTIPSAGRPRAAAFEPGVHRLLLASEGRPETPSGFHRIDAGGAASPCPMRGQHIAALAFAGNGLLVTGSTTGEVLLWKSWCDEAAAPLTITDMNAFIHSIAVSADGSRVAVASPRLLRLVDRRRGASVDLAQNHRIRVVSFTRRGDVIAADDQGFIRLWSP